MKRVLLWLDDLLMTEVSERTGQAIIATAGAILFGLMLLASEGHWPPWTYLGD